MMYWRLEPEVMPAESALSCVQCHASLQSDRTCDRCHQDSHSVDFKKIAHKGIDFKALGCKGDPIIYGGRVKKLPMGYKARAEE